LKRVDCLYFKIGKRKPAEEFVNSLDYWTQRRFFSKKDLLEEFGHKLPEPHAKYIKEGIFELRFTGGEGRIRILYFFYHQDRVILTNGFIKKTQKIPRKPLETAIKYKRMFLEKYK
jgi:phage-related protein